MQRRYQIFQMILTSINKPLKSLQHICLECFINNKIMNEYIIYYLVKDIDNLSLSLNT